MKWYQKFWQKLKRFSIPNLMLYISSGILFVYVLGNLQILPVHLNSLIAFDRGQILSGQIWRVVTFLFQSPYTNFFSLIIMLYFYTFLGRSLEQSWGSVSFTRYYLLGYVGTILGGFIAGSATSTFLNLSLFLAFAILYPNMEFRLFFIIPVKAKYLAYADGILYLFLLVQMIRLRDWAGIVSLFISLINLIIFFGPTIYRNMRHRFKYRDLRRQFRENQDRW